MDWGGSSLSFIWLSINAARPNWPLHSVSRSQFSAFSCPTRRPNVHFSYRRSLNSKIEKAWGKENHGDQSPGAGKKVGPERNEQKLARLLRNREEKEKSYRERALKLFPARLRRGAAASSRASGCAELTVHHKDHDHDNNPPDGSNWELLCLYCHDHEHVIHEMGGGTDGPKPGAGPSQNATFKAFAGLESLLKSKTSDTGPGKK